MKYVDSDLQCYFYNNKKKCQSGELGIGSKEKYFSTPCKVDFGATKPPILTIGAGFFHVLAVSVDGKQLFTWGDNDKGMCLRFDAVLNNGIVKKVNLACQLSLVQEEVWELHVLQLK